MKETYVKIDYLIKAVVVFSILICFFFRFYKLNSIPPDIEGDAAVYGMHALKLSEGLDFTKILSIHIVYSYNCYLHIVWCLLLGFLFKIIGATRIALFIPSVLISILTIVAIYIVSFRLFKDRLNALLSSFFLASSLWFLPYSRYQLVFIAIVPLLSVLTIYFIYQYEETNKKYYIFCLSGVIGIGILNGYINFLILLPVIIIYETIRGRLFRSTLNYNYWLVVVLSILFYLAGAVCLSYLAKMDSIWSMPYKWYEWWFKIRINEVKSDIGFLNLYNNLKWIIKDLFFYAQFNSFACLVVIGYALLSPLESIILLFGVIKLFVKRDSLNKLFLTWIFVPIIIYLAILKNNEMANRYFLPLLPAICMIVGNEAGLYLKWLCKKGLKYVALIIAIIICVYTISRTYNGYFRSYKKESANLTYQYGFVNVCKYINNQKNKDFVIILGDEVLVPYLQIHFYTKGVYENRLYYLGEFIKLGRDNPGLFKNKTGIFIFTLYNEKVAFADRSDNLNMFREVFPDAQLDCRIKYKDGIIAKEIYKVIL